MHLKAKKGPEYWVMMIILTFTGPWSFMIAVGIIHAEWIHQLPTIGYWWSLVIISLIRGAFAFMPVFVENTLTTGR